MTTRSLPGWRCQWLMFSGVGLCGWLLTLSACVPPLPEQPTQSSAPAAPGLPGNELEAQLSVERMMGDIAYLAADRLAGRASGMPGAEEARDYLVQGLQEAGARPAMLSKGCLPETWGDPSCEAGWLQEFKVAVVSAPGPALLRFSYRPPLNSALLERVQAAALVARQLAEAPRQDSTWLVEPNSPKGNVSDVPVVFAGYGIEAVEWNDYVDLDVKGRLVVVLAGAPDRDLGTLAQTRLQSLVAYKAAVAKARGAVGLMVLHDELPVLQSSQASEAPVSLPVLHVQRSWLELHIPGFSLDETLAFMAASGTPQSKVLPLSGSAEWAPTMGEVATWNVVAALGPELGKRAPLVVTAHYDHLSNGSGYSLVGRVDGPFNGADDNASGVAVALELVRVLAAEEKRLERPVVFLFTGGEELGLKGSRAFIEEHALRPSRILAVLNLDMVGRMESGPLYADEMGSSPALETAVEESLRGLELVVTSPVDALHGSSEHDAFLAHDVPAVSFTTGWHGDWHAPGDDIDKLDRVGLGLVARLVFRVVHRFSIVNDLTVVRGD